MTMKQELYSSWDTHPIYYKEFSPLAVTALITPSNYGNIGHVNTS